MEPDPATAIESGKRIAQSHPSRDELVRQIDGGEAAASTNLEAFATLAIHGGAKTDMEAADAMQAFVNAFSDEDVLDGLGSAVSRLMSGGKLRATALVELVCGSVDAARRSLPVDAQKVLSGACLVCKDGGLAALEALLGVGSHPASDVAATEPTTTTTNAELHQGQERS
jgi:hypothetical protein